VGAEGGGLRRVGAGAGGSASGSTASGGLRKGRGVRAGAPPQTPFLRHHSPADQGCAPLISPPHQPPCFPSSRSRPALPLPSSQLPPVPSSPLPTDLPLRLRRCWTATTTSPPCCTTSSRRPSPRPRPGWRRRQGAGGAERRGWETAPRHASLLGVQRAGKPYSGRTAGVQRAYSGRGNRKRPALPLSGPLDPTALPDAPWPLAPPGPPLPPPQTLYATSTAVNSMAGYVLGLVGTLSHRARMVLQVEACKNHITSHGGICAGAGVPRSPEPRHAALLHSAPHAAGLPACPPQPPPRPRLTTSGQFPIPPAPPSPPQPPRPPRATATTATSCCTAPRGPWCTSTWASRSSRWASWRGGGGGGKGRGRRGGRRPPCSGPAAIARAR
jgi:hypothetical protein